MKAKALAVGTQVWTDDEEAVWALGEVVHQENTLVTVVRKTGEKLEIDLVGKKSLQPCQLTGTLLILLEILLRQCTRGASGSGPRERQQCCAVSGGG